MYTAIKISAIVMALTGCGIQESKSLLQEDDLPPEDTTIGAMTDGEIMHALRTNCAACHQAGANRFIFEEKNDAQNIQWLRTTSSRLSPGQSWSESIKDTINWPGGRVPRNGDRLDEGRRFMPYGAAKTGFATAKLRNEYVRLLIIENL